MYTTGPSIYELLISAKTGIQDGTEKLPVSGQHCRRFCFPEKFNKKCRQFFPELNEAKNQQHKNSNGGH